MADETILQSSVHTTALALSYPDLRAYREQHNNPASSSSRHVFGGATGAEHSLPAFVEQGLVCGDQASKLSPSFPIDTQRPNSKMHGYGRFAVLSDLEEEEDDREENDADEVAFFRGEYKAIALTVEEGDTTSELDSDYWQPELTTTRSDVPGSDDLNNDAMFEPDVVCDACQAIYPAEGRNPRFTGHLRVDVANASGCRLCEALLNVWTPVLHSDSHLDLEFEFMPREGYFMRVLDIIFRPNPRLVAAPQTARFGFQKLTQEDSGYPPTPSFTVDLPNSTRLEDSERQLKKWLEDCKHHEACRRLSSEEFIPSRLLEISRDLAGDVSIRLRCRDEFSHAITYAALSHCWGSFMPLKLEESKVIEYRERIPLEDIPPVFRDAIDVSVALDIWYIWIDALCIIQDSEKDWQTESAMMCDIYSYCFLNIAADGSEDGSQGLFRERNTALLKPIHIVVETDGTPQGRNAQFSELDPGKYLLFDIHCWKHEIDDSPLGKRGWVIQERALSARTIHFGKTQIAWECRHLTCNEVFQDKFLSGTIQRRAKGVLSTSKMGTIELRRYEELKTVQDWQEKELKEMRRDFGNLSTPDDGTHFGGEWHEVHGRERSNAKLSLRHGLQPCSLAGLKAGLLEQLRLLEETKANIRQWDLAILPTNLTPTSHKYMSGIQESWCDIVQSYTECDLSYTSDKLVTIAGIAQMISRVTECRYLAGLWRKDLEHQLMWKVVSPSPTAVRDGTRGPSWSWAAVDGTVTWNRRYGRYTGQLHEIEWLARVVSCETKTITPNLFGQVASGSLVVSGPLIVLKVTEDKYPRPNMRRDVLEACKHGADIFWDSKESHERFGRKSTSPIWNYRTYHAGPAGNGDDVFFMPFRIMQYDYLICDWEAPMLNGLLLLPCTEARGTYQRVGQLTISGHRERDAFEEEKRPLQSGTEITDHRLYQSALKNGEYTITIV
ncbi:hypothetical protein LTS10_012967 [Elasticomyces elasticus]|nr:hypothetical protein LTS10_012967 [Elasticomyces elasticus]